jgi:hypothetical protein
VPCSALTRFAVGSRQVSGSWLLLAVFIVMDAGQALTMDWAEKRSWDRSRAGRQYARQSVLVANSFLSIVSGLAASGALGGFTAVRQCFNLGMLVDFLPVSICFGVGLSLKMMAVNHFQAGTIKIIGQLRLPMLAIMSSVVLARSYTVVQWQVIAVITTSCFAFVLMKGQGRTSRGKTWKWSGLNQLFGWTILNVMGGITAERTYKSGSSPFYVQKVSEDFGHLLIGLIMLYIVAPRFQPGENIRDPEIRPGGFFDSWDYRTVVVLLFLLADAWLGNALLKEFSGVTRSIAKAFSVSFVYFVSLFYSKDRKNNPALTLIALLVIQATVLFTFIS